MNKKLLILSFIASSIGGFSQEDVSLALRHIAGVHGIDFTGGEGLNSYNGEIRYFNFWGNKTFYTLGFNYDKTTFPSTVLGDYSVKPAINYTLFKMSNSVYINIEGGVFAGIETNTAYTPSDNPGYTYPSANTFIYGLFFGANAEIYINSSVALIGSIQQMYIGGCPFGDWKYQLNGGFRFIINQ